MRMWMVEPAVMCRKHLLGEHVELHMFVGTLKKGISVKGYLADNLMEPASLHSRHDALVIEMGRRGYNHQSPLPIEYPVVINDLAVTIDRPAALAELVRRCPECAARAKACTSPS